MTLEDLLLEWQAARAPHIRPNSIVTPEDWTRLSKAEQALADWISRHPMKPTEAKE